MTPITGTWRLRMRTPIGTIDADYRFEEAEGVLTGTATGSGERVLLADVTADGNRVTWSQRITKPIRLNLTYDVTVTGDHLTGHSRAGRLPPTPVTGERA